MMKFLAVIALCVAVVSAGSQRYILGISTGTTCAASPSLTEQIADSTGCQYVTSQAYLSIASNTTGTFYWNCNGDCTSCGQNQTVTNSVTCLQQAADATNPSGVSLNFNWAFVEPDGPAAAYTLYIYQNDTSCTGTPTPAPQTTTNRAGCYLLGDSYGYATIYNGTSAIVYGNCNSNCNTCTYSTWVTRNQGCAWSPNYQTTTQRLRLDWTYGVPPPPPPPKSGSASTLALSALLAVSTLVALF